MEVVAMKMVRTKALLAVAVVSALCAAAPAGAIPVTDTVNPTDTLITFGSTPTCPALFSCTTSALTFVHDITDNGFSVGDTITGATIDIHLTEQVVTGVNHETFRYDIGTQTFSCISGNCVPNPGVTNNIALVASLADLEADGTISITVRSLSGNFLFADSVLTAEVTPQVESRIDAAAAVPVPSTALLFGAGLAAFGWRFRRPS
jgi:hypothetical protein